MRPTSQPQPPRTGGRKTGRASPAPNPRANLYDAVTDAIIAQLEAGVFPWAQPWGPTGTDAPALPRNAVTGRRYSGVNILLLWGATFAGGHASHDWLTFRQALAAGGAVRKGERGTTVVYAHHFTPEAEKARARETGEDARVVPFLKRFTVFNLDQCEGLDRLAPAPAPRTERDIIPSAEALIAASGADLRIGGDRAFYAPGPDFIRVPPQAAFFAPVDYYRTALHELTHWTGHPTRLGRDQSGGFATPAYAREELAAEMGSAFLCAALGVVPTVRHADYLGSWLSVLREDNRALFRAASQASKAADFLLAFAPPDPLALAAQAEGIAA
ncbi:ArdC family protein [Hephaestia sp. GCM10023244]|uniref:ArdC family protein n=1 Tax=unclassified Hephaestia TaxID=2631281 RepID=UPI0020773DD3|nr:zincin-like metallopeptidase domain-containing protein [Hephaestia sp. MAHUQ-44]MCM8731990.1 zincin-like metallopeptidase domain-containing protein [Hephaestia sp. MAHUQ-44]